MRNFGVTSDKFNLVGIYSASCDTTAKSRWVTQGTSDCNICLQVLFEASKTFLYFSESASSWNCCFSFQGTAYYLPSATSSQFYSNVNVVPRVMFLS